MQRKPLHFIGAGGKGQGEQNTKEKPDLSVEASWSDGPFRSSCPWGSLFFLGTVSDPWPALGIVSKVSY